MVSHEHNHNNLQGYYYFHQLRQYSEKQIQYQNQENTELSDTDQ